MRGQKKECYTVEEVIELDDLDEDNISAEAGKQGLAELFHTQTNINLPNHIELQNVLEYKFLLP